MDKLGRKTAGATLKAARRAAKMTLLAAGNAIGMRDTYLCDMEGGRKKISAENFASLMIVYSAGDAEIVEMWKDMAAVEMHGVLGTSPYDNEGRGGGDGLATPAEGLMAL